MSKREKPSFEAWMNDVDKWLNAKIGLSSSDLMDCCYRDMYDNGLSAKDAALDALETEADDMGLDLYEYLAEIAS